MGSCSLFAVTNLAGFGDPQNYLNQCFLTYLLAAPLLNHQPILAPPFRIG